MASIAQPYVATVIGPKQLSPLDEWVARLVSLGTLGANVWQGFQNQQQLDQAAQYQLGMLRMQQANNVFERAAHPDDARGLGRAYRMPEAEVENIAGSPSIRKRGEDFQSLFRGGQQPAQRGEWGEQLTPWHAPMEAPPEQAAPQQPEMPDNYRDYGGGRAFADSSSPSLMLSSSGGAVTDPRLGYYHSLLGWV